MGMGGATTGVVTYRLEEAGDGTRVTVEHEAIGTFGQATVDSDDFGWADLNARLRAWLQDGATHGVAGSNTAPEFTFEASVDQ